MWSRGLLFVGVSVRPSPPGPPTVRGSTSDNLQYVNLGAPLNHNPRLLENMIFSVWEQKPQYYVEGKSAVLGGLSPRRVSTKEFGLPAVPESERWDYPPPSEAHHRSGNTVKSFDLAVDHSYPTMVDLRGSEGVHPARRREPGSRSQGLMLRRRSRIALPRRHRLPAAIECEVGFDLEAGIGRLVGHDAEVGEGFQFRQQFSVGQDVQ